MIYRYLIEFVFVSEAFITSEMPFQFQLPQNGFLCPQTHPSPSLYLTSPSPPQQSVNQQPQKKRGEGETGDDVRGEDKGVGGKGEYKAMPSTTGEDGDGVMCGESIQTQCLRISWSHIILNVHRW